MLVAFSLVALAGASFTSSVAPPPRDIRGWAPTHTFTYTNPVTAVAFGPDLVAAGDRNGVVILWHAQTGKKLETLLDGAGDTKPINRAQFSLDGKWLHFATNDGHGINKCRVEKTDRVFPGLIEAGWMSHGISNDNGYWLMTALEAKILIQVKWNGETLSVVPGGKFKHKRVVTLATGDGDVIVGATDEAVMRWENGKNEPRWEKGLEMFGPTALTLSSGGKIVALAGKSGDVRLYSVSTGNLDATLAGHKGAVTAVAFSPDGKQLATGGADATTRVWDVATRQELAVLKGHTSAITAVAFSPGGNMLATGSEDKTARVWVRK
jgi:hypothetical protein